MQVFKNEMTQRDLHLLEWLLPNIQEIIGTGKEVENRKSSCAVGGNVNWCGPYGKYYGDSSKN